jgi:hypothetical protein
MQASETLLQLAKLLASTIILLITCLPTITCGNVNTIIACRDCDTAQLNILLNNYLHPNENKLQHISSKRWNVAPVPCQSASICNTKFYIKQVQIRMQNLLNSAMWNSLLPCGSHQVTGARLCGHSQIFNFQGQKLELSWHSCMKTWTCSLN